MQVAPAGADRVALSNHRNEVLICKLAGGRPQKVDGAKHFRIQGFSWSHDGRWLAYGFPTSHTACVIRAFDTKENKRHDLTRPDFSDFAPSFDPNGQYLYFLSSRVFDPVYDGQYFDLGFPKGVKPFAMALRKDVVSPFAATTRAPRAPGDDAEAEKAPATLKIDVAGAADRVVAFPVPEGKYFKILGAKKGAFFASVPPEGSLTANEDDPTPKATLEFFDFNEQKAETYRDKVSDFGLSGDGRTLLIRAGKKLRAVVVDEGAQGPLDQSERDARDRLDRPESGPRRGTARRRVAPDVRRGVASPARPVLDPEHGRRELEAGGEGLRSARGSRRHAQ